MKKEFRVGLEDEGSRLDKFLSLQLPQISRSKISALIKTAQIKVNNSLKKGSYLLKVNDKIEVLLLFQDSRLKPCRFEIPIIWEDDFLLVVDKPQGLAVHPHGQNKTKTLVNALIYMRKDLFSLDKERPGVVHRLDKETSGIMVLAKNSLAYFDLIEQFKRRVVFKEYRALAWGCPDNDCFEVNLPIKRKEKDRLKMEVKLSGAKEALTKIKVLGRKNNITYLAVFPKTGRMHQIRVHLNFLGFPILGDKKYGRKDSYKNLFLHAYRIKLSHPKSKEIIEFSSRLPEYFFKEIASQ